MQRKELIQRTELTGRMADECFLRIFFIHSTTVITHTYQGDPAICDLNGDLCGTCIDGILHQFFYNRHRPFDNFTGRNSI